MTPVALVALKKLVYAGQCYLAGDAFKARDASDASVLTVTGLASFAPQPVQTKVMEPEPPARVVPQTEPEPYEPATDAEPATEPDESPETDSSDVTTGRKKRTYRRRDMTAERE